MATVELIAHTEVGSGGAASVEFTSIPSTYAHLMVMASVRSSRSSNYDGSTTRFNSETSGNNQSGTVLLGYGGAPAGTQEASANRVSYLFDSPAANAVANAFSASTVWWPHYANTSNYKVVLGGSSAVNTYLGTNDYEETVVAGQWRSTAAMSSIKIEVGVGTFVEYSTFTLYGIN